MRKAFDAVPATSMRCARMALIATGVTGMSGLRVERHRAGGAGDILSWKCARVGVGR